MMIMMGFISGGITKKKIKIRNNSKTIIEYGVFG